MDRAKQGILQNLQDTYCAAHKLSIATADCQGKPLTRPSLTESGEALSRLMLQLDGCDIYAALERQAPYVREIQAVTRYDYGTFLNMKYIVAPLKIPGEPNGTVWAGPWLDDGWRESERSGADSFRGLELGLSISNALEAIPSAQSSHSSEIMSRIGEFAEVAAAVLRDSEESDLRAARELSLLQTMNRWTSSAADANEEEALRLMLRTADFEVAGYARKMEHERFEIVSAIGEDRGLLLLGQSFHSGEGCLGHAALIRKRTIWEQASGKSGGALFSRSGCELEWAACYPIFVKEEVQGVLFGGMATARRPSPFVLELVQSLANHWGSRLYGAGLQATQKRQALLLSMLSEIHHSIDAMQDPKRILSIMVESMHKLIGGSFSGIVLFGEPGRTVEAQAVSKGLSSEHVARYAGELSDRYLRFAPGAGGPKERSPCYRRTSWGVPALEIPLYYGSRVVGVLSVGMPDRRTEEEDRFFLSSLAIIGEMRLFELWQREATPNRSNLELLGFSLSYWDPEGYPVLLRNRELLDALSRRMGFASEARERIDQAYMVSRYETSFLWETIPWHADAIGLLEEAKAVIEHRGQADAYLAYGYSQEAQALALILNRSQAADSPIGPGGDLQSVALGVRAAFEELLEEQALNVNRIAIGPARPLREDEERGHSSLTLREREVLELLIQGYTNQEIAEHMFISAHTVKNHLTKIYTKLGVADRTSAMVKLLKT